MDIESLRYQLQVFAAQRNWDQFHTPKNLSMALAGEVGELLELFQWLTEEQSQRAQLSATTQAKAEEELADICLYLIRLADKLGIDLEAACQKKLLINEAKYPVQLAYNNATKYNRRDE